MDNAATSPGETLERNGGHKAGGFGKLARCGPREEQGPRQVQQSAGAHVPNLMGKIGLRHVRSASIGLWMEIHQGLTSLCSAYRLQLAIAPERPRGFLARHLKTVRRRQHGHSGEGHRPGPREAAPIAPRGCSRAMPPPAIPSQTVGAGSRHHGAGPRSRRYQASTRKPGSGPACLASAGTARTGHRPRTPGPR